jgi:hypothetical protein
MGATSVTGVGPGSARAGVKGPGNGRSHFVPQLNPHVVAAGIVTMAGGTQLVTFPSALAGSETGYIVVVQNSSSVTEAYVDTKTDASGDFASFLITTADVDAVIMWMVVNAGHGLDA